jgi:hypothetical protein
MRTTRTNIRVGSTKWYDGAGIQRDTVSERSCTTVDCSGDWYMHKSVYESCFLFRYDFFIIYCILLQTRMQRVQLCVDLMWFKTADPPCKHIKRVDRTTDNIAAIVNSRLFLELQIATFGHPTTRAKTVSSVSRSPGEHRFVRRQWRQNKALPGDLLIKITPTNQLDT